MTHYIAVITEADTRDRHAYAYESAQSMREDLADTLGLLDILEVFEAVAAEDEHERVDPNGSLYLSIREG